MSVVCHQTRIHITQAPCRKEEKEKGKKKERERERNRKTAKPEPLADSHSNREVVQTTND